jgi:hypothetical protein
MEQTTVFSLLIGAAIGAGFTVALQMMGWAASYHRSRRFVQIALGLLSRHVVASRKSLAAILPDQPIYLQVARIRFCKVGTALVPGDMERIGLLSRTNERARILMMTIRNSDIFLDEVADRMERMNREARMQAIADAGQNMLILEKVLHELGFGSARSAIDASGDLAGRAIDSAAKESKPTSPAADARLPSQALL